MKKRLLVILSIFLFLVGCSNGTETTLIEENSAVSEVESEEIIIEDSDSSEVLSEADNEYDMQDYSEETFDNEITEEVTESDSENMSVEENLEEVVWATSDFGNELEYTVTVLEERMEIPDMIPGSDLVTLQYEVYESDAECAVFFAYIEDGTLYYFRDVNRGFYYYTESRDTTMKKMPLLNNIKRMKTFNSGSGVDPVPCLITETGEVYFLNNTWPTYNEQMTLRRFEMLKDYQVEDILWYESEWSYNLQALLKDGTVIELHSESWDN